MYSIRPTRCVLLCFSLLAIFGSPIGAQESETAKSSELTENTEDVEAKPIELAPLLNGSMETANEAGVPKGWLFVSSPKEQQSIASVSEGVFEGESAAAIDCTQGDNQFTNLMQFLKADGYRGKRVRYRAAVRTDELDFTSRVQLWFRVDLESGMGAFDNMQERPISTKKWKHFDVVLDVAKDAKRINVGMFVIGKGKVWIDDATLEVVDDKTPVTTSSNAHALSLIHI